MLSSFKNNHLIPVFAEYIKVDQTRDALRMIIGLSAELEGWECFPEDLETKKDFRFFDSSGKEIFSFLLTQKWLRFYFKKEAVNSGQFDFQTLSTLLDTASENNAGEWSVKIHDISELKKLWAYAFRDHQFDAK